MATLLMLLSSVVGIAAIICWVMVEIKMFSVPDGTVKGIIGIVTCGIYALIWGWQNKDAQKLDMIVKAWTGLWVVGIILYILRIVVH